MRSYQLYCVIDYHSPVCAVTACVTHPSCLLCRLCPQSTKFHKMFPLFSEYCEKISAISLNIKQLYSPVSRHTAPGPVILDK